MNKRFGTKRVNNEFILAFVILIVVSVTTIVYSLCYSDMVGGADGYARNLKGRPSRHERTATTYTYAQKDIGFGDGSVAVVSDGLSEHLFPFDPNTADSTTLLRLGLRPWQVRSIYKYRAHGGKYHKVEDFARLYGLTLEQYRRLKPYIRIRQEVMAADVVGQGSGAEASHDDGKPVRVRPSYQPKLTANDAKVDINTADTTLLKRIPGIGSWYANRIVQLRERRKVILNTDELLSIRNFPESALAYMTVNVKLPPLRINTMTLQELQAHPLLTRTQADDIVKLRRASGRISSLKELRFLTSFRPEQLSRIAQYIVFE